MDSDLLTYPEAAELLKLKLGSLYALVAQSRIPHVRFGPRFVRFSHKALTEWVRRHVVTPTS